MGLFDLFKKKRKETVFESIKTESEDANAETSSISNPTIAKANDSQSFVDIYTAKNIWLRTYQNIIDCLENNRYIEFDFLKDVIEVEPDGYGGTNRVFYFEDGVFYSRLSHWDAGNMFANRSYAHARISKTYFACHLDKKKTEILQKLSEEDKIKVEPIYNDIQTLLLKKFNQS